MKEKILLDTNMMIYILDDHVLDEKILKLTKLLYDSDKYKIVIHDNTFKEAKKIKDPYKRDIFISKLKVYNKLDNPPIMTREFNEMIGCKNENDKIDNEMLYVVLKNCVSYFITNDKKLLKKSEMLNLTDRVLSIDDALDKFKQSEKNIIKIPVFIKKEYLYNMDLNDDFFNTLKEDYFNFDKWFISKQREGKKAYITTTKENKIGAFLMLKEENENEDYSLFEKPFKSAKRIKVSTFKVRDTGKKIGECFIKIMINEAIKNNVDEIYITVFEKQSSLICLLEQYGFKFFTYKNTIKGDENIEKELVYVKNMKDKSQYPYVQLNEQNVFIFPIKPEYHKLLFEDAENEYQISINDVQGKNTSANAIKKSIYFWFQN